MRTSAGIALTTSPPRVMIEELDPALGAQSQSFFDLDELLSWHGEHYHSARQRRQNAAVDQARHDAERRRHLRVVATRVSRACVVVMVRVFPRQQRIQLGQHGYRWAGRSSIQHSFDARQAETSLDVGYAQVTQSLLHESRGAPFLVAQFGRREDLAADLGDLVTRNYAYVQPLANGDVRPDGIDLNLIRTWDALPRVAANSGDIHGGEASFARYLLGLAAGDRSLVGLPIFLMRGFRQRCFFVSQASPFVDIAELAGKRVGINEWPATGNTWARALLRERGVEMRSVRWLVGQVSAGYKPVPNDPLPAGVDRAPAERTLVDMLASGEIDALVCPWPPAGFYEPDSPVRRLYPDFATEEKAYLLRTGILKADLGMETNGAAVYPLLPTSAWSPETTLPRPATA